MVPTEGATTLPMQTERAPTRKVSARSRTRRRLAVDGIERLGFELMSRTVVRKAALSAAAYCGPRRASVEAAPKTVRPNAADHVDPAKSNERTASITPKAKGDNVGLKLLHGG